MSERPSFFCRILEIIETFQRDVQLPDRNFTVALRNLLLNVRVTTEKEEKNGVYFLPEPEGQLPVRYVPGFRQGL